MVCTEEGIKLKYINTDLTSVNLLIVFLLNTHVHKLGKNVIIGFIALQKFDSNEVWCYIDISL